MTASLVEERAAVRDPGVYTIPEAEYHSDQVALSCSGAKRLLPPSCPALFRHEQLNGRPNKRTFDFGHAAHAKALGVGAPIVVVQKTAKDGTKSDAENYQTKSAQEHRDDTYAQGQTPLLATELATVDAMASQLRAHPIAAEVFDAERGLPEQSLYRTDDQTGVTLRSRLDWLPEAVSERIVIGDYKTTAGLLDDASLSKALASFRYDCQAPWYVDMVRELGLASDVHFVFVFQMKTAPYLVRVVEPDEQSLRIGRADARRAIDTYAECLATDTWPSWSDDIDLIRLPKWATYDRDDEEFAA